MEYDENKPFYSVKTIFQNHWQYYKTHYGQDIREVEMQEVEKMLSCKSLERGYFAYYCKKCDKYVNVLFGCNSRICSCCGKRYTDQWSDKIVRTTIKGVNYKHLTFSMPEVLWKYFWKNMKLFKVMMDAAAKTIQEMFSMVAKKKIKVGIIIVAHPFGRDLKFKPHVHPIATYGGFDKDGKFVKLGYYIDYNIFHKKWQYNLLTSLRDYIPSKIIDNCFTNYPNGFVAYIRPDKIWGGKSLAKYIARYVRHPAIANSRIIGYDGKIVEFYYDDHEGKRHYVKMNVVAFIAAIIQHIPERNMRLVRYYGMHARNKIKKTKRMFKQSVIVFVEKPKKKGIGECCCPHCGEIMNFVLYVRKPPPKNINLITNW